MLLWNLTIPHRVYTNRPLERVMIQLNPVHILTLDFSRIHFNIILVSMPASPSLVSLVGEEALILVFLYT
jgi:hypothetical protein